MISRVSAALVKFLSPVSVSAESTRDSPLLAPSNNRSGNGGKKENPRKKENPPKKSSPDFQKFTPPKNSGPQVSGNDDGEAEDVQSLGAPTATTPQTQAAGAKPNGDLGHNLTQLIFSFEGQKKLMKKWLGKQVYPHAAEEQKTSGKMKKGVILDHKS